MDDFFLYAPLDNKAPQTFARGSGYHILAAAIGVALMIMGGGRWSADGVMARKLKR